MESEGRLASGVAHDFNNMLSVIIARAEMRMCKLDSSKETWEDLQQIFQAAQRSATLVRQLLVFSRRREVEPRILDLDELVLDTSKMLRRLISEDIELVFLPSTESCPVMVDTSQVEQVLMNLAVNARDAMPQGGNLILTTANVALGSDHWPPDQEAAPSDYVLLAVSDTGAGMSQEVKDRIFEASFTTRKWLKAPDSGWPAVTPSSPPAAAT